MLRDTITFVRNKSLTQHTKMKLRLLLLTTCFCMMFPAINAQNDFNVEQITVINLGDGRLLHRTKESEKPIEGTHRIIDGRRSEYKEVEFAGGLYNGKYQFFKSNKLREEGNYKEGRKNGVFKEYN